MPVKKLNSGFCIPILGYGVGVEQVKGGKKLEAVEKMQVAIKMGVNRFDTAESYACGESEKVLGEAIKGLKRPELFITSKISPSNLRYDDVLRSAENSLKRVGLDYFDLYLIHSFNPRLPIKNTMRALDHLKERGMIINIGVSNFDVNSFKKTQYFMNNKIVLNQVHYNLRFREPVENGMLNYCQKNDVFLEAFRSLEFGRLAEKGGDILDRIAKKRKKTQAQIAINWLLSQKNVVALFSTYNLKHLREDLGVCGWKMEEEDVEFLTEKFPVQLD
jgi:diketogulonate reductase-like aldo/keto reductase